MIEFIRFSNGIYFSMVGHEGLYYIRLESNPMAVSRWGIPRRLSNFREETAWPRGILHALLRGEPGGTLEIS